MLFVPAWINKFYIMDLQPNNSLIRYTQEQGHSVFVISWVNPTRAHADLDFADYMKLGPLKALDVIRDITDEEKANVLGFCIGGILVTAMLGYLAAKGENRIGSAPTPATMVDFKDLGDIGVFIDKLGHSAIRFVTPHQRHLGEEKALLAERHHVYQLACAAHPELVQARRATGNPVLIGRAMRRVVAEHCCNANSMRMGQLR